jgi:hypothetical protein
LQYIQASRQLDPTDGIEDITYKDRPELFKAIEDSNLQIGESGSNIKGKYFNETIQYYFLKETVNGGSQCPMRLEYIH